MLAVTLGANGIIVIVSIIIAIGFVIRLHYQRIKIKYQLHRT